MKEGINYLKANLSKISPNLKYSEFDFHIKASDMNGIGNISGMELAIFISLVSSILEKPVLSQCAILGNIKDWE